jgi:hypothetical protein
MNTADHFIINEDLSESFVITLITVLTSQLFYGDLRPAQYRTEDDSGGGKVHSEVRYRVLESEVVAAELQTFQEIFTLNNQGISRGNEKPALNIQSVRRG